ncbi:3-dehydroquinate synthase [Paenibacillus flagellatus]|uniref:3-dehydroquinate synthase n=1 Tax=Paenibacillus flagellatus TaxID=2211139 RepID=A0A2V5K6K8_9BACL|nr:3-dehydroquinate synthase [Paenibacillus flagellatus]PYI54918.1 3-dehydroquinate synthase [Paenibacillus flagellatus]
MRELKVDLGERSYPIYIGEGILDGLAATLAKHGIGVKSPLLVVTDENVAKHYLTKVTELLEADGYRVANAVVAPGEKSKSLSVMEEIITVALEAGLDRNSAVIALGGGVVGDLAGFVAASYMRGVRFVQIPTTILAHDSSVGGKVAVNHRLAKNVIGAFHQPEFVLYDIATLKSLPDRVVREGLSELVKEGFIMDREFVEWCDANASRLLALDSAALEHALYIGCGVKAKVVSADEKEGGLRAVLNLGHTIGHALEAVAGYDELHHGEAIAIGMVGAALLSAKLGNPPSIAEETERILRQFGLPVRIPAHFDTDAIMSAMMHDKKFKEGKMVFIVPTAIGQVEINPNVPSEWVREIVDRLKGEA